MSFLKRVSYLIVAAGVGALVPIFPAKADLSGSERREYSQYINQSWVRHKVDHYDILKKPVELRPGTQFYQSNSDANPHAARENEEGLSPQQKIGRNFKSYLWDLYHPRRSLPKLPLNFDREFMKKYDAYLDDPVVKYHTLYLGATYVAFEHAMANKVDVPQVIAQHAANIVSYLESYIKDNYG